ncbi:MAG: hypothetical protein FGM54_08440 [Chitinophagaceae bacterium]|nr:hypothetical protein [Chitinophagaceae bacterium]
METLSNTNMYEISWSGPFDINNIKTLNSPTDFGVYTVYGTHNIFGINTLLYIGKAEDRSFGERLPEHEEEWCLEWHHIDLKFYIGRFGSTNPITDNNKWKEMISKSERLLINHCKPPFNAKDIKNISDIRELTLFNFGKRQNIPAVISSQWIHSDWWKDDWKEYSNTTLIHK